MLAGSIAEQDWSVAQGLAAAQSIAGEAGDGSDLLQVMVRDDGFELAERVAVECPDVPPAAAAQVLYVVAAQLEAADLDELVDYAAASVLLAAGELAGRGAVVGGA